LWLCWTTPTNITPIDSHDADSALTASLFFADRFDRRSARGRRRGAPASLLVHEDVGDELVAFLDVLLGAVALRERDARDAIEPIVRDAREKLARTRKASVTFSSS